MGPFAPRAWDRVLLPRSRWIQVRLRDGVTVRGRTRTVAESADTNDLDLYLTECEWVYRDGTRRAMTGVEGLLVPRVEITRLQVLAEKAKAESALASITWTPPARAFFSEAASLWRPRTDSNRRRWP